MLEIFRRNICSTNVRRTRTLVFVTLIGCLLSIAFTITSFVSEDWLRSDVTMLADIDGSGDTNVGLFKGSARLIGTASTQLDLHIVCLDGRCMYSYFAQENERQESLNLIMTNATLVTDLDPLLSEGLWISTIVFLSLGLVFGMIGAVFAVVNTATTPIEAIFGIPGLYVWNGVAGSLDLLSVICWVIQFHKHLSQNVLLELQNEGWTTEGMEQLGYSFWLVVAAMLIHGLNCLVVFGATYEPKVKMVYENPEDKPGIIMLY